MISNSSTIATLPAKDITRAERFYEEKLGLKPVEKEPDGGVLFRTKNNCSSFLIYPSEYAGTAKNTALAFETDNIEQDMRELRTKGVVFEEYNMPGLKTVNGLATMENIKSAWFKDTEGNILALNQMPHHN
jgi:catechol 2,3-dioxygenase-like lactoylglutathione lyase family enzyme